MRCGEEEEDVVKYILMARREILNNQNNAINGNSANVVIATISLKLIDKPVIFP